MNFEYIKRKPPLRVLFINPLVPTSKLLMYSMLTGKCFGDNQLIDLTILVFEDEVEESKSFIVELEGCAFSCYSTIQVSTSMPRLTDADVFIIVSDFKNPNLLDYENANTIENYTSLYLLLKIALNLRGTSEAQDDDEEKREMIGEAKIKPLIACDGLLAVDILHTFSTNVPPEYFVCPASVGNLAKSLLKDRFKPVQFRKMISDIYVFGADDQNFRLEYENPVMQHKKGTGSKEHCSSLDMTKSLREYHYVYTPSWLLSDFVEEVKTIFKKKVYGRFFKASRNEEMLHAVWKARENNGPVERSVGLISDGSLDTIKGLPYFLPCIFCGQSRKVNTLFQDNVYVQGEIKKINKVAQENHTKLVALCKRFARDHLSMETE